MATRKITRRVELEIERLVTEYGYSKEILQSAHYDYLIFGHRHFPLDLAIGNSHYINLGDWIQNFTYASFDGEEIKIDTWN